MNPAYQLKLARNPDQTIRRVDGVDDPRLTDGSTYVHYTIIVPVKVGIHLAIPQDISEAELVRSLARLEQSAMDEANDYVTELRLMAEAQKRVDLKRATQKRKGVKKKA